ncbi:MAG: ribonuclease III [Catonella sp.]|uniref:ribonuclease III n=1 Tax=Catonella sp. TaxID=2382125 RepID=UPI003FA0DA13
MNLFIRPEKAEKIEKIIGYSFKDRKLLVNAFSHSSFVNEKHLTKSDCNERMEFLGDAVLELITSEYLFRRYKEMQEGELTKLRAGLVCEASLSYSAREIKLYEYLLLGHGEAMTGGRNRDSILSDAMEALIGAIYLDGGLTNAKEFIEKHILNDVENKKLFFDSKTIFQEMVQSENIGIISYKLIDEYGPDHDKKFREAVYIDDKEYGIGEGHTKKAAEQVAAYNGILKLKAERGEGGLCI